MSQYDTSPPKYTYTREQILNYVYNNYPYYKWDLHEAQLEAIKLINDNYNKTVHFVSCGNSFGKTFMMCMILTHMCVPSSMRKFHCKLFDDYDNFKKIYNRNPDIWIVGTHSNFLPGGAISSTFNKICGCDFSINDTKKTIKLFDQQITIKYHDQDQEAFSGANVFAIFVDEPLSERIYYECLLRLREPNSANKLVACFTPVNNTANYMLQFQDHPDVNWIKGAFDLNPYVTEEQKQRIMRMVEINPDEASARLYGEFSVLSDRVFKTFIASKYITNELPSDDYSYYVSIDPHSSKACFATLCAVNRHGTKYIIDNYPSQPWDQIKSRDISITEQVNEIKQMCLRWCDPNNVTYVGDKIYFSNPKQTVDGVTNIRNEWLKCGIFVNTSLVNVRLDAGHQVIMEHLWSNEILFLPSANNLITAMERYTYMPISQRSTGNTSLAVNTTWECPIATLRFLLTSKPHYNESKWVDDIDVNYV